jgi:hypothetical protein
MTTKFAFGYGDGDIYRRRMQAQDEMFRKATKEQEQLPEEDRQKLNYGSDYYGFRGAGRRAGTASPRGGTGERQGYRWGGRR